MKNSDRPAQLLIDLIGLQNPEGVKSGDWDSLADITVKNDPELGTSIVVRKLCIGFQFNTDGSFAGIYNFKE